MPSPALNKNQLCATHPAQYLASVKLHDVKGSVKEFWCTPYDADPILEPELVGMSYGQVILFRQFQLAARGVGESVDRLLDRMIGKPEQTNKNLNLQGSYKDFLEEVAKAEGIIDIDGRVVSEGNVTQSEPLTE
jgi:hypothetical protein